MEKTCRIKSVLLFLFAVVTVVRSEYRTFDGSNNNIANPDWGKSGIRQLRNSPINSYSDAYSGAIGTNINSISPRRISNVVFARDSVETDIGASDLLSYWGQFLDHDIVLTPAGSGENLFIPIPECDTWFDPSCTITEAQRVMRITRSLFDNSTGVRTQLNKNTAYMDASMVYGSDSDRASKLRLFIGGKMNVSEKGLPYNSIGYPMDNNARKYNLTDLFLGGDVRANENPALTALHVLFLREHNRWCDIFAKNNTAWDDEKLYQEARRMVIGIMQNINMNEYLPAIMGKSLAEYKGYNSSINPGIDIIFSSAGFRYGHSEISTHIARVKEDRTPTANGDIPLRDGYFDPTWIANDGVDDVIRGVSYAPQQRVDVAIVDDLRNFLFGKPGQGGFDLVAINIMRGRDHGIPDYNTVREIFGLKRVTSFREITADATIANALQSAYGSVDNIDCYVGGLAEDSEPPANIGPLFSAIYEEQMIRLRDGDRFWFENPDYYTAEEISTIRATTLTDVILRNTNITRMPCFPFFYTTIMDCPALPGQNTSNTHNVFKVALVVKSTSSPTYGTGNAYGYSINGVESAELTLTRGVEYTFQVPVTCLHPFYLTTSELGNGILPVTSSVCGGKSLTFTPTAQTPNIIYYQCMLHVNLGWKINVIDATTTTITPLPIGESTNTYPINIISILIALVVCICI